jgi:hypothetical protein
MNCAEKFIKHSERVGARFAEQNAGELLHDAVMAPYSLLLPQLEAMTAAQNQLS